MAIVQPTFFKLRDAKEYRFYNRLGQRAVTVRYGQVIPVLTQADIDYFRSRRDVMVECVEDGTTLEDVARKGHLEPAKVKSYKVYGRAAQPVVPAVPVGKPPTSPKKAPSTPEPVEAQTYAPRNPAEVVEVTSPIPSEPVTPIEEASADGTTRVVSSPRI